MKNDISLLFAPIVADVNLHVEYEAYEVGERLTSYSFVHSALTWIFIYGWGNFALKTIAYGQVNSLFYFSRVRCFYKAKLSEFDVESSYQLRNILLKLMLPQLCLIAVCSKLVPRKRTLEIWHTSFLFIVTSVCYTQFLTVWSVSKHSVCFPTKKCLIRLLCRPTLLSLLCSFSFSFVTLNCFEIEWRVSFFRRFKLLGSARLRFASSESFSGLPFVCALKPKTKLIAHFNRIIKTGMKGKLEREEENCRW